MGKQSGSHLGSKRSLRIQASLLEMRRQPDFGSTEFAEKYDDASWLGKLDAQSGTSVSNLYSVDQQSPLAVPCGLAQSKCPECGKVMSTKNIRRHYQARHQGSLYPCDLCSSEFNRSDNLRKHMREKHSAEMTLACPVCREVFIHKIALEEHVHQCHVVCPAD
jgi:uncharacterized Zn-finger protein